MYAVDTCWALRSPFRTEALALPAPGGTGYSISQLCPAPGPVLSQRELPCVKLILSSQANASYIRQCMGLKAWLLCLPGEEFWRAILASQFSLPSAEVSVETASQFCFFPLLSPTTFTSMPVWFLTLHPRHFTYKISFSEPVSRAVDITGVPKNMYAHDLY